MPPAEFEAAIPLSERPKAHALDRAATTTGLCMYVYMYRICSRNLRTLIFK